jgi:hypothetical protein
MPKAADPQERVIENGQILSDTVKKCGIDFVVEHTLSGFLSDEIIQAIRNLGGCLPRPPYNRTRLIEHLVQIGKTHTPSPPEPETVIG